VHLVDGEVKQIITAPQHFWAGESLNAKQIEAVSVATESRRVAHLNLVPGQENANPLAPALQTDVIAVAHVTLTPAGVEEIAMVEENQLSSVQKNLAQIRTLESWKDAAGTQIDTLKTGSI